MIYICDFFAAREAVSNQIELLRSSSDSFLFSASRFLNQKNFQLEDLKNKRVVVSERIYRFLLPLIARTNRDGIHYFEEEPSENMRNIFNKSSSNLFISMYRRPNLEYAEHLKGYKNLKYVFVELEEHKRILVRNGINEKKVLVYRTPSLFTPQRNKKSYNPRNVNLLFASWNNAEGNPLEERGINYLLNLVAHNPNLTLTVMPRDNLTNEFTQKVKVMNLGARVKMKWPIGLYELKQIFQKCDFVAFTPKIKISKDVPNSIIDGLSLGKPCIITNIIDFSRVVEDRRMGLVINDLGLFKFTINKENYLLMSKYAYDYSSLHSDDAYSELIDNYK